MPLALQRLLAPAIVLPVIVRILLSSLFITGGYFKKKSSPDFREAYLYILPDYILLPVQTLMAMKRIRAIINSKVWFIVSIMVGKNNHYFKKTRESSKYINFLNLPYTY
jgi:uncharacterized membrane protein YphA (DoxX/SURF4 family)